MVASFNDRNNPVNKVQASQSMLSSDRIWHVLSKVKDTTEFDARANTTSQPQQKCCRVQDDPNYLNDLEAARLRLKNITNRSISKVLGCSITLKPTQLTHHGTVKNVICISGSEDWQVGPPSQHGNTAIGEIGGGL